MRTIFVFWFTERMTRRKRSQKDTCRRKEVKDTFTARRTVKRSGFAVFHLKKKDGVGKQGIKKMINANLPNLTLEEKRGEWKKKGIEN
jgi:hypothetical protein